MKRVVGILLFVKGTILLISAQTGITGNIISETIGSFSSILGLIMIVGGLFMFGLEKSLQVYSTGNKNTSPEQAYHITDPELLLSDTGRLSLEEFRQQVNKIKNDSELIQLVEDSYIDSLKKIKMQGGEKAKIAKYFLEEIGIKEEKQEIKELFKEWRHELNNEQKKYLEKNYNVDYKTEGKHIKLYSPITGKSTSLVRTPSDFRSFQNGVQKLITFLEEIKKNS